MALEKEQVKMIKYPAPCERRMSLKEMYGVSRLLEAHHSLFYMIWEMGLPMFTRDLPTAAVLYDPTEQNGKVFGWCMNPEFWDECDDYKRAFVIGHECLHILFNHIERHSLEKRYKMSDDKKYIFDDSQMSNIAQDIVINHALVKTFKFQRELIKDWEQYCWMDTIWPNRTDIPDDECFEFYYNLLKEDMGESASKRLMDSHEYFDLPEEIRNEIEKTLNKQLSTEEKKALKDMIEQHVEGGPDGKEPGGKEPGKEAAGNWIFVNKPKPVRKPKWENIVREKVKLVMKNQYGMTEQWAQKQRNHSSLPLDMKIPAEIEDYDVLLNKAKLDAVFFLDASGSCYDMADRFFKAAASVPRKTFNIHLCSFDTRVYELDVNKPQMQGGGGTSFRIMEDYIQGQIACGKMKKYPDVVFVITDGYGDDIRPEKPKKWFFLMTEKAFHCLPPESTKFMLSEFE
jgi:hypothetical protein